MCKRWILVRMLIVVRHTIFKFSVLQILVQVRMWIQSAASTSVEAAMPFASNHREHDYLCPWVQTNSWQSCSESGKLCKDESEPLIASNICAKSRANLVKGRNLQKNSVIVFPVEAEKDEASRSVVNGSLRTQIEYDNSVVIALPAPLYIKDFGCCNDFVHSKRLYDNPYLEVKCSSNHNVDFKSRSVGDKELRSNNIRTSTSETGVGCCNTNIEGNDIYHSDISGLEMLDEDLSIREFCVSLLKSYSLHVAEADCSIRSSASAEVLGTRNERNFSQSCKTCGKSDNTLNMLLCDNCDEAFHASCCNPRIKFLLTDNWYCHCCSNLKHKGSQENPFLKSPSNSWSYGISRFEMGPIELMLKYPEPYRSCVRIGEPFQAEVPHWSNQLSNDLNCIGEPLEMDPAETISLHVSLSDQFSRPNTISNWLQCQEVLNNDTKGCVEGAICAKWRRAPFSEIQTDDWDCSCAVRWDPLHSDCAVPQELETNEVLRHLKNIEQLRSRFAFKKRKT